MKHSTKSNNDCFIKMLGVDPTYIGQATVSAGDHLRLIDIDEYPGMA